MPITLLLPSRLGCRGKLLLVVFKESNTESRSSRPLSQKWAPACLACSRRRRSSSCRSIHQSYTAVVPRTQDDEQKPRCCLSLRYNHNAPSSFVHHESLSPLFSGCEHRRQNERNQEEARGSKLRTCLLWKGSAYNTQRGQNGSNE